MTSPSQTPAILAKLRGMEVGQEFTAREISVALPDASKGAIGGFVHSCVRHGMLERIGFKQHDNGTGRPAQVYKMIDPTVDVPVSDIYNGGDTRSSTTRNVRTGPMVPRLDVHMDPECAYSDAEVNGPAKRKRKAHAMTPIELSEELLLLAEKAERMQPDLSKVPSDELMEELRRRMK